jgi:hypothetical protein
MRRATIAATLFGLLLAAGLAGCASEDPAARIAIASLYGTFEALDLADALAATSGRPVQIAVGIHSEADAVAAVVAGHADAAFVEAGTALWAWLHEDWEIRVIAAATYAGAARPETAAWVLDDATYPDLAALAGARSCHPSPWDMAGSMWPLAALVRAGLVTHDGAAETTPGTTGEAAAAAPAAMMRALDSYVDGQWALALGRGTVAPYGGYAGALKCLSHGLSDVAFTLDAAPSWACDAASPEFRGPGGDAPTWCRAPDAYRRIATFAPATGTVVIASSALGPAKQFDLVEALLTAPSGDAAAPLDAMFESQWFVVADERDVLGPALAEAADVPGLRELVLASGRSE